MNISENTARILRSCNEIARCIGVETPIRILLVDDSDDYCMVFKAILRGVKGTRYDVDVVNNVADAEAAIARGGHDLYVIDLCLGGQSGVELVRRLQERGEHFPFVVITGGSGDDRVAMGRDCMMWMHKNDYVSAHDLDRALRYSLKNWLIRNSKAGEDSVLPPMAVPA